MLLNPRTHVKLSPSLVEYRTPTTAGVQVVRVILTTGDPRIVAFSEEYRGGRLSVEPMSLFVSEVQQFVSDALERVQPSKP